MGLCLFLILDSFFGLFGLFDRVAVDLNQPQTTAFGYFDRCDAVVGRGVDEAVYRFASRPFSSPFVEVFC